MEPLIDAIAAGNTAMVKPSAYSPETGSVIRNIIKVCFPEEYVAVVTGGRKENQYLLDEKFDFIYSVAVVHMLVLDEDRNGFYQFIHRHLKSDGIALICSMGDGNYEMQSDISNAFELQEREHETGKMMVAGTSCRMVSFSTFENELLRNGLKIIEKGITSAMPNFNSLMYAIVQ